MKAKVFIHTRYYENYNVNADGFGETPHWKEKGGVDFIIELDTDNILYCDNKEEVFQKMLDKHETIAERFEYDDYTIQWHPPVQLGTEEEFLNIMTSPETIS